MKLNYTYIVGTQFMFYELKMLPEYIDALIDTLSNIENKENVTFDFNLNISEYFEKIDTSVISKEELISQYKTEISRLKELTKVNATIYDDDHNARSMVDYRRDLNYNNCKDYDYVIWGESDAYPPRQIFEALDMIKAVAAEQNIHKYITTFGIRKMWDDSWKILEHNDMTDKPYYGLNEDPELATNSPWSIRYTMSKKEMDEINNNVDDLDVRLISYPKFDGSFLCISSDLIKAGANVPHAIFGHFLDDTSMMYSCMRILGNQYKQFVVKNLLKVHNRVNPKKRHYAIDYQSGEKLSKTSMKKGDWFYEMEKLVQANLANVYESQSRFNTLNDFEKNNK